MFFLLSIIYSILMGMLFASESGGTSPGAEIRTLTIQEAVRLTLSRAPEVLLAEAQALRTKEMLRETRSLNRPRAFAGTGLAYNNGFPLSIEGSAPSIFQVNAMQPFLSKKNTNLIREAEESEKAGRFGTASARSLLASRTASVYYELHQMRKVTALASARVDTFQKQQKQVETLLEAGRVRPIEATLMKTAALSARQQLLIAQEQSLIAEKEIRELTGLPATIEIRTAEPQIDGSSVELQEDVLYERTLKSDPGIQQAEANVRAKDFHIEAEKGERWPKMEIVSQYALLSRSNNYEDYFNRFMRHNYLIGLSVQVPIFDGSGASARIAQSKLAVSEARYKLQRMKSDLKLDIQKRLSALRIARGAVDLARSDMDAAREMVQVNTTLMESGRILAKDLEDSRAQLLQKELAVLDADRDLFQKKLDLLFSTGDIEAVLSN
jgi:outer membrane protein